MEREVGGGIGMGNTCKPMAVLFQCMTKFTTNKKKKRKKKNKDVKAEKRHESSKNKMPDLREQPHHLASQAPSPTFPSGTQTHF